MKVTIQKGKTEMPFFQISHEDWQNAIKTLNFGEFALYLYLAGNADGDKCSLNLKSFEEATGFKKSTYYAAIKRLQALGYLVEDCNGKWHFLANPLRDYGITPKKQNFGETF
ncbi:MAG: hypothetical protein J6D00_08580 [Christensenellaceae bacterium]|nr:hypothetical protein [Christensenellaceae bacterium]